MSILATMPAAAEANSAPTHKSVRTGRLSKWSEDKHPRGVDGKFIENEGDVHLENFYVQGPDGRYYLVKAAAGKVKGIRPSSSDPGNPDIDVEYTAPDGSRKTATVKRDNIRSSSPVKARLDARGQGAGRYEGYETDKAEKERLEEEKKGGGGGGGGGGKKGKTPEQLAEAEKKAAEKAEREKRIAEKKAEQEAKKKATEEEKAAKEAALVDEDTPFTPDTNWAKSGLTQSEIAERLADLSPEDLAKAFANQPQLGDDRTQWAPVLKRLSDEQLFALSKVSASIPSELKRDIKLEVARRKIDPNTGKKLAEQEREAKEAAEKAEEEKRDREWLASRETRNYTVGSAR